MSSLVLSKIITRTEKISSGLIVQKADGLDEERAKYEASLFEFAKASWYWIEGNIEFHTGWHIEALCEHLEATYTGEIRNLLINVPPRSMKSTLTSVIFPAWIWTKDPSLKFLCASYSQFLSVRDSTACRRLIQSEWYQKLWGNSFRLTPDVNTKLKFDNNKFGYRFATSVGGSVTGFGADWLIADDPNNAQDIMSEPIREGTNLWWDAGMSLRLNNFLTGRKIVVQQRLHERDVSGHILGKATNFVHLCLPMEFEKGRRCSTIVLPSSGGKVWKDPRTKEGELLWPTHIPKAAVDEMKAELANEYSVAGQLQQRPAPLGGGIFKREWFNIWEEPELPKMVFTIQSWDTAFTKSEANCYSACTTWGIFEDSTGISQVMLVSAWRGRVEYPELREMALRLGQNYHDMIEEHPTGPNSYCPPDVILIEAKANGLSLIQDLYRSGLVVTRFDPNKHGNKLHRAGIASSLVQGGRVWLPGRAPNYVKLRPFAQTFLDSCLLFPNAESNDFVDTMSQAFIRIRQGGYVGHPQDPMRQESHSRFRHLDKPLYG